MSIYLSSMLPQFSTELGDSAWWIWVLSNPRAPTGWIVRYKNRQVFGFSPIPNILSNWMSSIECVNDMADNCNEDELKTWTEPIKTLANFCYRLNVGKRCRIIAICDDAQDAYDDVDFLNMVPMEHRHYVELDYDAKEADLFITQGGRISPTTCNTLDNISMLMKSRRVQYAETWSSAISVWASDYKQKDVADDTFLMVDTWSHKFHPVCSMRHEGQVFTLNHSHMIDADDEDTKSTREVATQHELQECMVETSCCDARKCPYTVDNHTMRILICGK